MAAEHRQLLEKHDVYAYLFNKRKATLQKIRVHRGQFLVYGRYKNA